MTTIRVGRRRVLQGIGAGTTAEIAFVADNPGDWMFHCHVLDHQASGMMALIRVA